MPAEVPQAKNAVTVIIEHLQRFHQQVWTIDSEDYQFGRVYTYPPAMPSFDALPIIFFLVGGMNNSIPQTSSNSYILDRTYTARIILTPMQGGLEPDTGQYANELAAKWYMALQVLYVNNLRLEVRDNVDYRNGLPHIAPGFSFRDTGLKPVSAPSGIRYWGFDIDLDIPVRIYSERQLS